MSASARGGTRPRPFLGRLAVAAEASAKSFVFAQALHGLEGALAWLLARPM